MSKPYSRELNQENDERAREAVKEYYFWEHGRGLVDFPLGKYGADLGDPDSGLLIETEIKKDWKCGRFPFPDLRITKRKSKLLTSFDYPYDHIEFWVLSDSLTMAAVVEGHVYRQAAIKSIDIETTNFKGVDDFRIIEREKIREFVYLGDAFCKQKDLFRA